MNILLTLNPSAVFYFLKVNKFEVKVIYIYIYIYIYVPTKYIDENDGFLQSEHTHDTGTPDEDKMTSIP